MLLIHHWWSPTRFCSTYSVIISLPVIFSASANASRCEVLENRPPPRL